MLTVQPEKSNISPINPFHLLISLPFLPACTQSKINKGGAGVTPVSKLANILSGVVDFPQVPEAFVPKSIHPITALNVTPSHANDR
jgi:hypothetical protein